jgi:hypothetical protein
MIDVDSRPGFASDFAEALTDKKATPRQVKAFGNDKLEVNPSP